MEIQNIFKRYEYKYLLTTRQKEALLSVMEAHMREDEYGRSTICNLYFDTPQYLLIRRSIENPVYKEKIRLRTYGRAGESTLAFIELKKKYKKVVYKRRISESYIHAIRFLNKEDNETPEGQITSELEYALSLYKNLRPAVYLAYEREAFYGKNDSDLRITFDQNILWRTDDLDLRSPVYGRKLIKDDEVLMEIKIGNAMPLWLSHFLSEQKIYRTSFSKYGLAYKTMVREGEFHYAS